MIIGQKNPQIASAFSGTAMVIFVPLLRGFHFHPAAHLRCSLRFEIECCQPGYCFLYLHLRHSGDLRRYMRSAIGDAAIWQTNLRNTDSDTGGGLCIYILDYRTVDFNRVGLLHIPEKND